MSGQKTLPEQQQDMPGTTSDMKPVPDHGEESYRGSDRLAGKRAIITGGDSGIGRAVAIAFAREGADLLVSYLCEHDDAKETARWVEQAGRKCVLVAGDIQDPAHCRKIVDDAATQLGGIDILVNTVAPGPVWTPLIPSTMPPETVAKFGSNVPMKRPAQPAELATSYVMLADPMSSYVSGATVAVTGGKPIL